MARTLAMFTDTSLCIGCRACQVACKQWNELGPEVPEWTGGYQNHDALHRQDLPARAVHRGAGASPTVTSPGSSCRTCASTARRPAVSTPVPTGAIYRTEHGTVNINQDVCNGCRYCVVVVPVRRRRASTTTTGTREEVHVLQRPDPQRSRARLRQGVPDRVHPVRLPRRPGDQGREAGRDAQGHGLQGRPALRRRLRRLPRRSQRVLPAAGQAVDLQPPGQSRSCRSAT